MVTWLTHHSPLLYFTQSLWRDEAFSILVAEKPLSLILPKLTFEPPVYYTLLHFWMKLFGNSEIATRGLSLVGFTLATIVVIVWAQHLYRKHWLSWFLPLFFFTNPMLLYYAFEVRTYAWYVFFAVLSMYAYLTRRFVLYVLATVLGFYTHTYFIVIPFVQMLHWVLTNLGEFRHLKTLVREPLVRSFFAIGILIAPWLYRVLHESTKLKESWYFPVNLNLVKSVLGNMFLGYEGTPWYLWAYTRLFSLLLLALFVIALLPRTTRKRNVFFFLMVIAPLVVVIGISFVKPLFVNRYLIPVAVAQVFLVVFALEAIKNNFLQKLLAFGFLLFAVIFNIWYPRQHAKLDIRTTIAEINAVKSKNDLILAESPLVFFETIYYAKDRSRVYLYNPNDTPFPWYVGDIIVSHSQMIRNLPLYPGRAFLVSENGSFTMAYRTSPTAYPVTKPSAPTQP